MRIEQYFLMTDYSLWEVIINGDSPIPTVVVEGAVQATAILTAEQKLAKRNELKAQVSAATSISVVCAQLPVSSHQNIDSLSNAVIFSFFASKSTSPQIDNEDLKQIDVDDLEEIDLRWQMAMLTMRSRRFLQKTGRNLGDNRATAMGFDMSKVECYNCHRKGYFARECRSYDWSYQAEEEPTNFALMVISSSSPASDNEAITQKVIVKLCPQVLSLIEANPVPSSAKLAQDISHTTRPMSPIIEDWVSDSEDESEPNDPQSAPSFVQTYVHAKLSGHSVLPVEASILETTPNSNSTSSKTKGSRRKNKKTYFVCRGVDHLIKDCNFHAKPKTQPTPRNSTHRGYDKQYASSTKKYPLKHIVPAAVITKSKPVSVTAARLVSAAVPKIMTTKPRHARSLHTKTNSNIRRHKTRSRFSKTSNSFLKVTAAHAKIVSAAKGKKGKWAEAVNTACYVQNQVLVTKPQNKTPYELLHGRPPSTGPTWLFDINSLTRTMNYQPVTAGNQSNPSAGFQEEFDVEKTGKEATQQYMLFPVWSTGSTNPHNKEGDATFDDYSEDSSNDVSAVGPIVPTAGQNYSNSTNPISAAGPSNSNTSPIHGNSLFQDAFQSYDMLENEDIVYSDHENVGVEADFNNLETSITKVWILVDLPHGKRAIGTKWVYKNKKDERGIVVRNKERLVAQGHTQEEGIDYKEVFAPVSRIEVIRLFLAYASFMGFMVYQMDVKSAFLYGTIEEEVHVYQPLGFEDPDLPDKVYKVVKAFYGLHQAPRAWIFRYLKGKPNLGLWYPKDSPFDLVAYSDSDYAGASLDRKSTTGGCQFLRSRLISWQCKKQTVVATSSTEAEYVAGASCCAQVLWIQNQILDYGKSDASEGFDQIIDFINGSYIAYALTVNQTIYVSCIKQFWRTVAVKSSNDVTRLQALVEKKRVMVTKAAIRDALHLDDAEGVDCLPNEEIFTELARIGYEKPTTKLTFCKDFFLSQWKFLIHTILQSMSAKRTSWNEFSSAMASAVICLSTGRKFNFSRYIFESLVRNVDSSSKFYMYPRFIHLIIQNQLGDLSTHSTKYISFALTQKVFANIRRVGKGCSGVKTPLFEGMIAAREPENQGNAAEQGDEEEHDTDNAAAEEPVTAIDDVTDQSIQSPTLLTPPPQQPQDIPSTSQVAQDLDILKLKTKVKKLERANKVKTVKLRRLKKVGTSQKIESSDDTLIKDVSNQGREFNRTEYAVKETEEVREYTADTQVEGRQADIYHIDMDHAAKVLSMQEDESEVQEAVEVVTTAKLITEVVATISETVSDVVVIPSVVPETISADVIPIVTTPSIKVAASVKAAVPSTRQKRGVVIWDPEEESSAKTPTETTSKDKGKCILVKEPKPMKKKQQVELDEAYARKLQEEINQDIDWEVLMDHNTAGFRLDYFKGMTYDDIRPIFVAKYNENMEFLLKSKEQIEEKESRAIALINQTPTQKAAKRRKLIEEAKEAESIKQHLQIVPNEDDDVFTKATPLARKVPIVDYQFILVNNKPRYKIIKANDTHQLYASFITMLKIFDREDLETLWRIVKESKDISATRQKLMLLVTAVN
nr:ribonuclease H-like domain-containing protein [Tanacetum cinerariifolium]